MWDFQQWDKFKTRFTKYRKNHPDEVVATINNLDTFQMALRSGAKPTLVHFGFLHREPQGVCAIDQSGAEGDMHETRLYVYADEAVRVIHLLTIGDKNSQAQDLADCRDFMNRLRKGSK